MNFTKNILSGTVITPLEYAMVTNSLARITASVANYVSPEDAAVKLMAAFNEGAAPIRGSFRWLDREHRSIVGFVQATRRSVAFQGDGTPPKGFRAVAGNMYMDEADKELWAVRKGASQNYLVRQGADDLGSVIQAARQTPVGNQPRMSSIRASAAQPREFMAFINTTGTLADLDHGFVIEASNDGSASVLSMSLGREVVVPANLVVASYEVDESTLPPIPAQKVTAHKAKLTAAGRTDPVLSPKDYYALAYEYAPEYVSKIMKQISEMAAI